MQIHIDTFIQGLLVQLNIDEEFESFIWEICVIRFQSFYCTIFLLHFHLKKTLCTVCRKS